MKKEQARQPSPYNSAHIRPLAVRTPTHSGSLQTPWGFLISGAPRCSQEQLAMPGWHLKCARWPSHASHAFARGRIDLFKLDLKLFAS
jgi:hypothetical protein